MLQEHLHNVLFSVGNVYIADYGNNRIRKIVVSTGVITTIAGTGVGSYSGDGDQATAATLYAPSGVSLDASGTIASSLILPDSNSFIY